MVAFFWEEVLTRLLMVFWFLACLWTILTAVALEATVLLAALDLFLVWLEVPFLVILMILWERVDVFEVVFCWTKWFVAIWVLPSSVKTSIVWETAGGTISSWPSWAKLVALEVAFFLLRANLEAFLVELLVRLAYMVAFLEEFLLAFDFKVALDFLV